MKKKEFEAVMEHKEVRGEVLASTYCMHLTTEDGKDHIVELTGEETISTGCPVCGKEHTMSFDDFLEIMKDGELFGTSVYCRKCTAKRNRMKT